MSEEEKDTLNNLLEKVYESECCMQKYNEHTCMIDCPYYVSASYGGACAIEIMQKSLS